ncbi:hypothetical protein ABK040_004376 [Willaertia magna]
MKLFGKKDSGSTPSSPTTSSGKNSSPRIDPFQIKNTSSSSPTPFNIYNEYNLKIWKEGYLIKEGRLVKSWKRRYFVIKGSTLSYYKNEKKNENDLKGKMDLKGAKVFYLGDSDNYDFLAKSNVFNTVLEDEYESEDDDDEEEETQASNSNNLTDSPTISTNMLKKSNIAAQKQKIENGLFKYKLCVIASDRELFMAAPSAEVAKDWCKRIRACIFVEDYFVDCKTFNCDRPLLNVVTLLTSMGMKEIDDSDNKKTNEKQVQQGNEQETTYDVLNLEKEDPFTISDLKALSTTCIQSTRIALTSLSITNCNVGDEHCKLLAHSLADNQTINRLDLSHNNISCLGISDLIDGLFINTTLKRLLLSHNNISDLGCVFLSDLLMGNTSIIKVDLSYNKIQKDGAKALNRAIANSPILKALNLGHNNIGDEGCANLADGLKQNSTLEKLDLSFNKIGSVGLTTLCMEGLIFNRGLKDLSFRGNVFDVKGANSITKALIDHKTLKRIDCGDNDTGCTAQLSSLLTTKYMVGKLVMKKK